MLVPLALAHLHLLDVGILVAIVSVIVGVALYTRRYTRSVADFLSANRCAGRYLLTVAATASGMGAITIVAMWEQFYQAGFTAMFWGQMLAPISLVLALSGWIIYRYRETRVLTMAQLMELRYSRRFRVFSGTLCWVSGVLNYGIFPAVTARFFIHFLGLPQHVWKVPGLGLELNLTMGAVMAVLLGLALMVTLSGGQISVMVTDFIQGQIGSLVFITLLFVLLMMFPWNTIVEVLSRAEPGHSMLNPFDSTALPDFGPALYVMLAFITFYNHMVWQGSQGYNASALTPHEARMAGILAQFRGSVTFLLVPMAAVCAYVMLNSDAHPQAAEAAKAGLAAIPDKQIATQMTTTVALSHLLPTGLIGLLAAVMLMASLACDTTYLHSWGSIFVQDVYGPIRQLRGHEERLSPERHLKLLRLSIFGVAAFAWVFSMLFPLKEYIMMYFQATGAIFTGGGGAVLIGALYWKRGTATGAWAAMITGSILAVGGILVTNILWPWLVPSLKAAHPEAAWLQGLPEAFWLNGVQVAFAASLSSVVAYVIASLLSPDPKLDTDRLFHRGAYAVKSADGEIETEAPAVGWRALLPGPEFTRGDKLIYFLQLGWVGFFFLGFVVMCLWQLFYKWPLSWWANWWHFQVLLTAAVGSITVVWFLIGGFRDLARLFCRLATIRRDEEDDGTVQHPPEA